jgi:DNA ligase-1
MKKKWDNQALQGIWEISIKIDGVRVLIKDGQVLSRAGKVLHGLREASCHLTEGDYEFFLGDFKNTISITRNHTIKHWDEIKEGFYRLLPTVDERLLVGLFLDPTKEEIQFIFKTYTDKGYEGLMLKQGDVLIKIKSTYTADIKVLGMLEGTGRNKGRLGAVITSRGKVGTGFSDADREKLWQAKDSLIGSLIEVSYMELTPSGKFRHPRFERVRDDKTEESLF